MQVETRALIPYQRQMTSYFRSTKRPRSTYYSGYTRRPTSRSKVYLKPEPVNPYQFRYKSWPNNHYSIKQFVSVSNGS
jgi:hypothetical protein